MQVNLISFAKKNNAFKVINKNTAPFSFKGDKYKDKSFSQEEAQALKAQFFVSDINENEKKEVRKIASIVEDVLGNKNLKKMPLIAKELLKLPDNECDTFFYSGKEVGYKCQKGEEFFKVFILQKNKQENSEKCIKAKIRAKKFITDEDKLIKYNQIAQSNLPKFLKKFQLDKIKEEASRDIAIVFDDFENFDSKNKFSVIMTNEKGEIAYLEVKINDGFLKINYNKNLPDNATYVSEANKKSEIRFDKDGQIDGIALNVRNLTRSAAYKNSTKERTTFEILEDKTYDARYVVAEKYYKKNDNGEYYISESDKILRHLK